MARTLAGVALTLFLILPAGSSATARTAPSNTKEPRVTGTAIEGRTLTAQRGNWAGSTPITYKYQWLRCDSSATNCVDVANATNTTYLLGNGDVGTRMRIRVTATNAAGSANATSNATSVIRAAAATGGPRNTAPPTISGNAAAEETLHTTTGSWAGAQPITFSLQWLRCDAGGNNCVTLPGATDDAYTLRDGDIGHTLRVRVTARNDAGSASVLTAQTAVVQVAAGPPGATKLPSGEVSIPATSVPTNARLVIDRVDFSPAVVRTRAQQITIRVKVKDTRGFAVRDALVFVRSTPVVTTTPTVSRTGMDGWITYTVQPERDFPIRHGYSVQFFVKAYRQGDPPLAGVAAYRLVQVRTEP
jgi:hypothetical protein